MKKHIFTLALLTLLYTANAQNSLKEIISAEGGISKHFTQLSSGEQKTFNSKEARAALSLDPSSDLVIQNTETDRLGFTNYRYFQTYKNIPIENSMFIAHVKSGRLTGLSGEIITEFDNTLQNRQSSAISSKQAVFIAIKQVNAQRYAWQDADMENTLKKQKGNANATYYPSARMVWYSDGDNISSRDLRLTWKVDVYARLPLSRAYYFVDAASGEILGKKDEIFYADATGTANTAYSGSQSIHSVGTGTSYTLRDITKGSGIITLHGETNKRGTDYTSTSANWSLTGANQAAMDAHYGVSKTYAFYLANFGRNSYDNLGTALTSYINDPTYTDNAFWDGYAMNFNKRSSSVTYPGGVTGIDVTGHELTHGVTQETSGLNYTKEPGAMNESMSDIMGKSVQFWSKPSDVNWMLSNDMNWGIRNMANPNALQMPDTYKGTYWASGSADNYGIHTNCSVGNFMFYLLVTGGSGTNDLGAVYSVAGIGLAKADQILYRTNTTYLTPNSQFSDWRQACISAANDLYPGDAAVLASVQNAWFAVGIGGAAGSTVCNAVTGLSATAITAASATLSWGSTGATAYNLQWKPTSSNAWTTVAGINGTTYNLSGLTAGAAHQFQVQSVCSAAASNYGTAATFSTLASAGNTYCTSSGSATYEYIKKVVLGTISSASSSNGGYGNYTNRSTALSAGVLNSITLTPGFTGTAYIEYWTAYIDYNQDGDFGDAGESVTTGSGKGAITKTFTVPSSAKNGPTPMRIQMKYAAPSSTDPCANFPNGGEVEDYTVNISGGITVSHFDLAGESKKAAIIVSPNPAVGSNAEISYTLVGDGKVTLRVMDMFGRTIQTITPGTNNRGPYTLRLNSAGALSAGNYIISLLQDNKIIGKTNFIVAK